MKCCTILPSIKQQLLLKGNIFLLLNLLQIGHAFILHIHCAWSLVMRVPFWGPLGGPLCQWPCYHCWIAWGMSQEALDLERSNGERSESKCRKNKDHDLWYGPAPPAEFRWVSMCRLLHWSGQQQHLLQPLQALGAQKMQWTQTLDKWLWLQMYMVPGDCTPHGWQTTKGTNIKNICSIRKYE